MLNQRALRLRQTCLGTVLTLSTVLVATTLHPRSSFAQHVLDPDGLPVCSAAGDQLYPRTVAGAEGAAIVVWQDFRRGASVSDVYALSVTADGGVSPGWPDDGRVLCASGTAGFPIPVPDGAGGALVLWRDARDGGQLYAQRVNADGSLATGWPSDGKALTTSTENLVTSLLDAIPDGSGGAYVIRKRNLWYLMSNSAQLTRITTDGTFAAGWSEAGLFFGLSSGTIAHDVTSAALDADPGAGAWVAISQWHADDPGYSTAEIYKVSGAASVQQHVTLPYQTTGDVYPPAQGTQAADVTTDGNGGFIAAWLNRKGPVLQYDQYAQDYSAGGSGQWPANTPSPVYQSAESDGGGGAYLIGSAWGVIGLDVHRRLRNGSLPAGWTPAGIQLTRPSAMGSTARTTMSSDLLVCWSENRTGGGFDIRATAVDSAGLIADGWAADGTIVSSATNDQINPALAGIEGGRALVCWQDRRSGAWDIRASRIGAPATDVDGGPSMSGWPSLSAPWPNPTRERAIVRVSLPGTGSASLEIVDVAGRSVRSVGELEAGGVRRSIEVDVRGLANGVYYLKLADSGRTIARRFAVVR